MNYWWVNHKQTVKIELDGGYIWSPFRNKDNSINQTYLNLERAKVNDLIFSYAYGEISAVGVVTHLSIPSPKPALFGKVGENWAKEGWLLEVDWVLLVRPLKPKDHLQKISPLLPTKHSPIRHDGNGNQKIYLASIHPMLGQLLLNLISIINTFVKPRLDEIQIHHDEEIEEGIIQSIPSTPTFRTALIEARNGQGVYRRRLEAIEDQCRLTGVSQKQFLIASHIKPWKDSNDEEKLDGQNGLLLSPHVDKLFDKGYLSFTDNGDVLLAHSTVESVMSTWGLDRKNVGRFITGQRKYLMFHRDELFNKKRSEMIQIYSRLE